MTRHLPIIVSHTYSFYSIDALWWPHRPANHVRDPTSPQQYLDDDEAQAFLHFVCLYRKSEETSDYLYSHSSRRKALIDREVLS